MVPSTCNWFQWFSVKTKYRFPLPPWNIINSLTLSLLSPTASSGSLFPNQWGFEPPVCSEWYCVWWSNKGLKSPAGLLHYYRLSGTLSQQAFETCEVISSLVGWFWSSSVIDNMVKFMRSHFECRLPLRVTNRDFSHKFMSSLKHPSICNHIARTIKYFELLTIMAENSLTNLIRSFLHDLNCSVIKWASCIMGKQIHLNI